MNVAHNITMIYRTFYYLSYNFILHLDMRIKAQQTAHILQRIPRKLAHIIASVLKSPYFQISSISLCDILTGGFLLQCKPRCAKQRIRNVSRRKIVPSCRFAAISRDATVNFVGNCCMKGVMQFV
jgi:hypothetical protein